MSVFQVATNRYFCQAREFAIGGHMKAVPVNLVGPTTYDVGGSLLDPQAIGAGAKGKIVFGVPAVSASGTYTVYLRIVSLTEVRLYVVVNATGLQAGAINLSAETFVMLIGFLP
jgi:hypothetical protein